MNRAAMLLVISMLGGGSADAAIQCQDAPGRAKAGVYWSWRDIEGKRCWFISTRGAMPPKSALTWGKEEPVQEDVTAAPQKTKPGPSIHMLRVRPVAPDDMSEVRPNRLNEDR